MQRKRPAKPAWASRIMAERFSPWMSAFSLRTSPWDRPASRVNGGVRSCFAGCAAPIGRRRYPGQPRRARASSDWARSRSRPSGSPVAALVR